MAIATKFTRDPLAFIHNNLIIVGDANVQLPKMQHLDSKMRATIELIDMEAEGYAYITNVAGRQVKKSLAAKITGRESRSKASGLYRVVMAGPNSPAGNTFKAYICPYRTDANLGTVLGHDADIMLTAEMTGCTFGVGSPTKDKKCMVMHANASAAATDATSMGMRPQTIAQAQAVTGGLGMDAKRWSPSDYRVFDKETGTDIRSTIIGVRSKSGWDFYAQKYDAQAADRVMLDVVKVS